jgi:hypothetical protein
MHELDPHATHMMPAHFGPRPQSPRATLWYRDVTSMSVAFLTDRDKLAAYLPGPFVVGEDPVVTITYACNRQVDWLAGHGYNMIAVNANAVFEGDKDRCAGHYTLIIWENLADPILTGRELQGIPKVYADIGDHSVIGGDWHACASHFGHRFLDIDVSGLREPTPEELAADDKHRPGRENPMAWRFLPGILGFGQSVSEATTYPSESVIDQAWVGEGRAQWQHLTWEQNPTQFHIVNALADLPVLEWLPATVAKGSTNLLVPDRLPRVLR